MAITVSNTHFILLWIRYEKQTLNYWALMTMKDHHHKQALCAVANRIVNWIFSVLKRGKPFELRDREGNSITLCEAKAIILERISAPVPDLR